MAIAMGHILLLCNVIGAVRCNRCDAEASKRSRACLWRWEARKEPIINESAAADRERSISKSDDCPALLLGDIILEGVVLQYGTAHQKATL